MTGTLTGARAWLVHSGAAGNAVQCAGLATALQLDAEVRIVRPPRPWRWLAPWGPPAPIAGFEPPWPDIAIATGRFSIPHIRALKRWSGGRTFTLVLKNPRAPFSWFDLVWVPEHDGVEGPNVITTLTAPHPVTDASMNEAAARFEERYRALPRPLVGVIVGGKNHSFRFGAAEVDALAGNLRHLADKRNVGLAVTCSRRTGPELTARLSEKLGSVSADVWDGSGENPYHAILALADTFIVTCESTNMVGEAASTGKPVHMVRLPGDNARFARFHAAMIDRGAARWFDGSLVDWTYSPINATEEIADAVRTAYTARNR